MFIFQARLKEGDRVAFKFRSDTFPSTAEVVRVRETKDRTDAGDYVVSIHYDVTECETLTATGSHAGAYVAISQTPLLDGNRRWVEPRQ